MTIIAEDQTDHARLVQTFAALANPTRLAILARLAQGEATVNELAAPFDVALPAISKHIKVLEKAGLVGRGQHAQFRPCTLEVSALEEVSQWAAQYRDLWEQGFDRMDVYLQQLSKKSDTPEPTNRDSTKRDPIKHGKVQDDE